MTDIRLVLHDGRPIVIRRRPPCPRWCTRWLAGGVLLAAGVMVLIEFTRTLLHD